MEELPSLQVTTKEDIVDPFDGQTSLREAIALANDLTAGAMNDGDADNDGSSNDTITFANSELSGDGDFILDAGELVLSSDITLKRGETDSVIIDAGSTSRVLNIVSGTVVLEGIRLENGFSRVREGEGGGGGIFQAPGTSLKIIDSVLSGNSTSRNYSQGEGGAILSYGDLFVEGSFFRFSRAFEGGALNIHGNAEITSTRFEDNIGSASGGAIYIGESATVTMSDSNFRDNETADEIIGYTPSGAGIHNEGTLFITNSDLYRSFEATNGGSIANYGSVYLEDVVLWQAHVSELGGAVFNAEGATLDAVQSSFVLASARNGGGIYNAGTATLTQSTITDTSADENGGGIANYGTLNLVNTLIAGNLSNASGPHLYGAPTLREGSIIGGDPEIIFQDTNKYAFGGGRLSGGVVKLSADPSNPALDVGDVQLGLVSDAAGNPRDIDQLGIDNGGTVDAGSTELQEQAIPVSIDGLFSFHLVNAESDTQVADIFDGAVLDPGTDTLPALRTIRADYIGVDPAHVDAESVLLELILDTGCVRYTGRENIEPYFLFGDKSGDAFAPRFDFVDGEYQIRASAYAGPDLSGAFIGMETISFSLDSTASFASLFTVALANSRTDEIVLEDVTDGPIDFAALDLDPENATLSITSQDPDFSGSLQLTLYDAETGKFITSQLEAMEPYALFGDDNGDFFRGDGLPEADSELLVKVFEDSRRVGRFDEGSGDRGVGLLGSFTVDIDIA